MQETIFTFKRYERKYLLSAVQFDRLWAQLEAHLKEFMPEDTKAGIIQAYLDDW